MRNACRVFFSEPSGKSLPGRPGYGWKYATKTDLKGHADSEHQVHLVEDRIQDVLPSSMTGGEFN
jgi:hypothetical protein